MKFTKSQKSWIMYDVACSAFVLILTATIPVFFRSLIDIQGIESVSQSWLVETFFSKNATLALNGDLAAYEALKTSLFALTTTIAVVVVAASAPIIGAIADYEGMKKKLFSVSLIIGVFACLMLGLTTHWLAYLAILIIARIAYSSCNIFYDSMLIDVAKDEEMETISSHGYAWGYIGSCIPFLIGIWLILFEPFNLDVVMATQISFVIVAIWWLIMSVPLLKNVKQNYSLPKEKKLVITAFKRISVTLKKIIKNKKLLYFIIGYFCYIDGVYTIISMSTTYGAEVGIQTNDMIIALLVTQIVGFPFAIIAGKLAQRFRTIDLIRCYIVIYIFIVIYGYQLSTAFDFWVLSISVGIAQGGIQSLSRAYYGKIIPKDEASEYYGFFDIFGKFADFLGPLIIVFSASITGSSRTGILALIILFVIGFILLSKVNKIEKDS